MGKLNTVRGKLLAVLIPVIVVAGILNAAYMFWTTTADLKANNQQTLTTFENLLNQSLSSKAQDLAMSVELALNDDAVVSAFADRDRQRLSELTLPLYRQRLKPEYGIQQFHFHLPNAQSFFRAHKPGKHGDDLSGFRNTVLAANEGQAVKGLEVGRGGLGMRVVYPVEHDGDHVGSVELGASAMSIFRSAAEQTGVQFAVGVKEAVFEDAGRFEGQSSDRVRGDTIYFTYSGDRARSALEALPAGDPGEYVALEGRTYRVERLPLTDYSDERVGSILAFKDVTAGWTAAERQVWIQGVSVVGAIVLVLALLSVLTSRIIVQPIRRMQEGLEAIASGSGDLTRRLTLDGRDEVAEAADAFNHLMEKLQGQMQDNRAHSQQLASASEELTTSAGGLQESAQNQSQRVDEVSQSIQEVNGVVQDVANNISEVSQAAGQVNQQAQRGNEATQKASEQMASLRSTTDDVNQISETIQSIAKKTDLLALNAAIEAANAGEAGQGFAVVADEVRKLAEQTSTATSQIGDILKQFHARVDENTTTMNEVTDAMEGIRQQAESTDEKANQIASAAEELAATMSETTDNLGEIREAADSVTSSVEEIHQAASQVDHMARELAEISQQFRLE